MVRIEVMYQRNHISMYLKYDVLGNSSFFAFKSATRTSKVVTDPMNLSEKSLRSMKRVKYASDQSNDVGTNVPKI